MTESRELRVVIVGAGFGGIVAAIELRKHGFTKVAVLEKARDLGGTWLQNDYPAAACDVPSHLYSYSFAQRRNWSRLCSPQEEILGYLHDVAREHGIDRLLVPNTPVSSCSWDEESRRWSIVSPDGRCWDADAVVLATGQLHRPAFPGIADRERFAGHSFHSAEWDHTYDIGGKRVAVIGTGASAVQFVPEIAKDARRVVVFQRTGNWLQPRRNRPYPAAIKAIIRSVPGLQRYRRRFLYEIGELLTLMIRHPRTVGHLGRARSAAFMRWQLKDPEVRRKVWPDYTFGCKRVLFSSHYLPALQRPNVQVVTDAITGMTGAGVLTADGREHPVDCVIYATGFRTSEFMFPMEIRGVAGRTLGEAWAAGAHAHLGITVPGFPSLFMMYGPNTNTSGGSIIVYEEAQAAYVRQALQHVRRRGAAAIEVRSDVETKSDRELQERFAGTAWTQCDSWYRSASGRHIANWPGYMRDYEKRLKALDPSDFTFVARPDRARTTA